MFGKRARDLTPADLARLRDEEVPESAEVEYKKTLPAKKGNIDPWMGGGESIGDYALRELLAEVIAFANAYGGTLFLGIDETKDAPRRAAGINPVPRCADLAERFRHQCRDCIDPQIPLLEIVSIPAGADGSGVLVVEVPKSMMGPHRSTQDFQCYVRRADSCEKMKTMREIKDLMLQLDRGIASLDARLEKRRTMLQTAFKDQDFPGKTMLHFAVSAVPVSPMFADSVHNDSSVVPPLMSYSAHTSAWTGEIRVPVDPLTWRPILRGSRGTVRSSVERSCRVEILRDGTIEYEFLAAGAERGVYAGWLMALVTNALCAVEKFRRWHEPAIGVEYAIDVSLRVSSLAVPIVGYGGRELSEAKGRIAPGEYLFPRSSVGAREEFEGLARIIENDLWNTAGVEVRDALTIEFAPAFAALHFT